MNASQIVKLVVDALEDVKGKNVEVIDTSRLTPLFEWMVLATGESNRQTRALARNVQDKARESGIGILSTEGEENGEWILVDLGEVIVHIMQPATRAYYNIEELWGGRRPDVCNAPLGA
ncbi:MAG: ribosome silencing factor [Candidatus Accumulibacter sp.]|jgi:ribosome-associated protein|nr:ribosome silencing factor [Accumulibacter sp.]